MMEALKEFLESNGYDNINIDFMPDEKIAPEVIYLGLWNHDLGALHDGTSTRYVQPQVRRKTAQEAKAVCNALVKLIDSGMGETKLYLNADTWCIARPTQGAQIIDRTDNTTTYYANITLWGIT